LGTVKRLSSIGMSHGCIFIIFGGSLDVVFSFYFTQKAAYEFGQWLESRRVLFRSDLDRWTAAS